MNMIVVNTCTHGGRLYTKGDVVDFETVPSRHFRPLDTLCPEYKVWSAFEAAHKQKQANAKAEQKSKKSPQAPTPATDAAPETPDTAPDKQKQANAVHPPRPHNGGKQ